MLATKVFRAGHQYQPGSMTRLDVPITFGQRGA